MLGLLGLLGLLIRPTRICLLLGISYANILTCTRPCYCIMFLILEYCARTFWDKTKSKMEKELNCRIESMKLHGNRTRAEAENKQEKSDI